jgi:hypothetical protein
MASRGCCGSAVEKPERDGQDHLFLDQLMARGGLSQIYIFGPEYNTQSQKVKVSRDVSTRAAKGYISAINRWGDIINRA